jgi:hypothetical protein
MKLSPIAPCAIALLSLPFAAPLSAQTLTAKEVMRIHFKMNLPLSSTPDVLRLNFGLITVNAAYTTRTAKLWDCGTLLGTASTSSFGSHVGALNLDPSNSWKAPGSLWNFDNPGTVTTFTPISSGTIRGIIDFEIATGSVTIPLGQVNLNLLRATTGNGGFVVSPPPTITEIAIVPKCLPPTPGTAGTLNTIQISGGQPGNAMWFGFGTICGPLTVPCSPPVTYDISNPIVFVPIITDPRCNAFLQVSVPATLSGVTVLIQGLEIVGTICKVTNLVPHTFP